MSEHSWTVFREPHGGKHDTHAALSVDYTRTLCGYPMPMGYLTTSDKLPTCKGCRSVIRQLEQEDQGALSPGNTFSTPISRLYPPVVERIDPDAPWNLGQFNVVEGDNLHAKIWGRIFGEAARYNPEPECPRRDYENALGSIVNVTVIQEGYLVELPRFSFNCLAPLVGEFNEWARQASGGKARHVYFSRRGTSQVAEPPAEPATEPAPGAVHPDLTDANYGNLMSLVQSEKWALVRAGATQKEAYNRALDKVAASLVPPVTPDTMRAFVSPSRFKHNGKERNMDAKVKVISQPKPVEAPAPAPAAPQATPKEKRPMVTDLYREWCAGNDYVPADRTLAHFGSYSASAYSYARNNLTEEGYKFTRGPHYGWLVERPLSPEERRVGELKAQMALIMAEIEALQGQIRSKADNGDSPRAQG